MIQPIEVIWTLVALAGGIYSFQLMRGALGDLEEVHRSGVNGPRLLLARARVRSEALRMGTQGCFLLSGIIALGTTPPSPPVLRYMSISALIVGAFLVTATSVLTARARDALRSLLQSEYEITDDGQVVERTDEPGPL